MSVGFKKLLFIQKEMKRFKKKRKEKKVCSISDIEFMFDFNVEDTYRDDIFLTQNERYK